MFFVFIDFITFSTQNEYWIITTRGYFHNTDNKDYNFSRLKVNKAGTSFHQPSKDINNIWIKKQNHASWTKTK